MKSKNTILTNLPQADRRLDLTVVMPVYNEEGAVTGAVEEWSATLDALGMDYEFRVLNDGSKDGTGPILDKLVLRFPRLVVTHKPNSGHGPTILQGYLESQGKWIFQTDSDRELPPDVFSNLWSKRNGYDYLQGIRMHRVSPVIRRIITKVALWTVRLMFGTGLSDINCPYRLMHGDWVRKAAEMMPVNTLTPNIVLSAWAIRDRLRLCEMQVEHSHRMTGTVSIRRWKLFKFAVKAFWQVLKLRRRRMT